MEDFENNLDEDEVYIPRGKGGPSKQAARNFFKCNWKQMKAFKEKNDPMNPVNEITGFLCRKDGSMGGSIVIDEVNGKKLSTPQYIYGTPKLEYPYKDFNDFEYKDFSSLKPTSFMLANKWNGTNILIFKYKDEKGKIFISAKSKGAIFLSNTTFGAFFTLTEEALGIDLDTSKLSLDNLPPMLKDLKKDDVQSITFELCGTKEPHLVKYDFGIELKPLFLTYNDGSIAPCKNNDDTGPFPFDNAKVAEECRKFQKQDFATNEEFRNQHDLHLRYEYDHFAIEGRVLYLLDANGRLCTKNHRTMYKVKPKDIEEVHWGNFSSTMQGRVREALEKMKLRNKSMTADSLQEELDMGEKEWGKFGKDVMNYANQFTTGKIPSKLTDKRQILLICGYPGSGRERILKKVKESGKFIVLDQSNDDKLVTELTKRLSVNNRVMIDRYGLNRQQRGRWIVEGQRLGVLKIDCVFFDLPAAECRKNLKSFEEDEDEALANKAFVPEAREGFGDILIVRDAEGEKRALSQVLGTTNEAE